MFTNPFEAPGRWLRANLHTHTTTSDGEFSAAERARQYREAGYQVLAITDHDWTNDISGLSDDDFLVINGMEVHPDCPDASCYHLVLLNVPHGFTRADEPDPNAIIRKVKAVGGETIIAHPYWCGHTVNHLLPIEGAVAVEVYNATCTKIGKGLSSVHWDDLLDAGMILPAVAVDDVHRGRDIFMGWTMIKAERLTAKSVMNALRTGCVYSSCGPVIEDARIVDGVLTVNCSPAVEINFIAQRSNGRSFFADGEPLTSAEVAIPETWRYVRVEVVDAQGRRAWTNPFILQGSKGSEQG
jgi:hypothetical protein